jgi:outer membrane protein OmpA-like peptidoglycan-associated protein
VSREDWRGVRLTLASSGPLTFAVNLQRPQFVARPDASGRMVEPTATGAVMAEHSHGDRDGDAILDSVDLCTADDEDIDGFEDDDGCADPDNDSDRITDPNDHCPNEPESYNGHEDEDGCPDRAHVVIEENRIVILDKIYFTAGSAEIRLPSLPILEAIAQTLQGNRQIETVEVQGHAAPGEPDAWGVSAARARAVRQALIDRGVDERRLRATPYGNTRPIDPRATSVGAERNRRAELFILAMNESSAATSGARFRPLDGNVTPPAIARSVTSTATPREVPGGTQYAVREPVTIPAGTSTLVSILNRRVHAEDVLLFRPGDEVPGSDRHPLRAARLVDDTGMDLVPGPVALFGRGAFVGEGILDGLASGENAFIPYALDRSTTVTSETEPDERPGPIVTLVRGVLTVECSALTRTRYVVEAGARPPARIFLRHARLAGTTTGALPPGTETSHGALLVPVPLTPGRRSVVTIEEQRPVRRTIQLLSDRNTVLGPYLHASTLSNEQTEALRAVVERRLALGRAEQEIADVRERLADVGNRSAELRETLASLGRSNTPAASALRRQVLERMRAATTSGEEHAARLATLQIEASELRATLADTLAELTIGEASR